MTWINANDQLPTKTDGFLVTKNIHAHGTFATYVHLTKKWMANIGGILWEIKGVQYWRKKPKQPTKKNKGE